MGRHAQKLRRGSVATPQQSTPIPPGELHITEEPEDVIVADGNPWSMHCAAEGGLEPYTYYWEYLAVGSEEWQAAGSSTDTYGQEAAGLESDGQKFRCTVTDDNADHVTTREALLTVTA